MSAHEKKPHAKKPHPFEDDPHALHLLGEAEAEGRVAAGTTAQVHAELRDAAIGKAVAIPVGDPNVPPAPTVRVTIAGEPWDVRPQLTVAEILCVGGFGPAHYVTVRAPGLNLVRYDRSDSAVPLREGDVVEVHRT